MLDIPFYNKLPGILMRCTLLHGYRVCADDIPLGSVITTVVIDFAITQFIDLCPIVLMLPRCHVGIEEMCLFIVQCYLQGQLLGNIGPLMHITSGQRTYYNNKV